MDITSIPPTVFVAFGVITAALLTGFFSFMNMVSAKENKVSEFRLTWIEGLREEIAEYTSAAQELVRVADRFQAHEFHTPQEKHELKIEWYKETRDAFSRAIENLSKIQLRLNPKHIEDHPNSPEASLMKAVSTAREHSVQGDFKSVLASCKDIRTAAAPILKSTWDLVKRGEPGYRRIRSYSLMTVTVGFYAVLVFGMYIGYNTYTLERQKQHEKTSSFMKTLIEQRSSRSQSHHLMSKSECPPSHPIPYRMDFCTVPKSQVTNP